jgi:hypothetical protein
MRPVRVEVITYTPTFFYHCQHCEVAFQQMGLGEAVHREQAREALPEDLRREFDSLSLWAHGVIEHYGPRVRTKIIDAASLEGFWKSFRYGVRRYPSVVVEGTEKHVGADLESIGPVIERFVQAASGATS